MPLRPVHEFNTQLGNLKLPTKSSLSTLASVRLQIPQNDTPDTFDPALNSKKKALGC